MKKIILLVLGLALVIGANAQIRWGVKAGGNLSEMTTKINDTKMDCSKVRFGFHIGGMMEYSFSPSFAIQPELLFSQNGSGFEVKTTIATIKGHTTINQIQLPINAKYKLGTDELQFFVTAGPYLGMGISAKSKINGADGSTDLYGDDGSLKRFDFGIGVGVGVEISKFMVGAGYQYGIANLSDADNVKSKMGTFQFSVGYFF